MIKNKKYPIKILTIAIQNRIKKNDINIRICQLNCQLKIKNPVNQIITGILVESPRIELGSKQATKKLSTRLFSD
jgi:hypothetical protein